MKEYVRKQSIIGFSDGVLSLTAFQVKTCKYSELYYSYYNYNALFPNVNLRLSYHRATMFTQGGDWARWMGQVWP